MAETKEKKTPRYAMVIDLRRCIGCHSCSVACKSENDVPLSVFRSWVKIIEKGQYPNVSRSFLPSLCNNCEKPICVQNCPTQASYQREDGIVMVDPHRCIACKYCIASCPYDVRFVNPIKRIVQKCYFCEHRVDQGIAPACVVTCLGHARIFGNIKDPDSEISKLLATNPVQVLKPDMATKPHVFYIAADLEVMDPMKGRE
ncbi:MAG: 4Fe-4S dicluster domain-containing protein [Candidatus Schekmanbacteria bacterium]|nr:4Fe-4S dicluster domain-containing protein [Candidatus Schekmanbacteria bacterium]